MRIMGLGSIMLLVLSVSLSCCSESTTTSARAATEITTVGLTPGTPADAAVSGHVPAEGNGY